MKNTRYDGRGQAPVDLASWMMGEQGGNHETMDRLRKNLPRAIMEDLTPRQREFIFLRFYEGKSAMEIALEKGLAKSTVNRTIARAKKRLERCLKYSF